MSVMTAERPTVDIGNLDGEDREIASAYNAGGFTAVLELAQRHQARLRHEWADLTRGLTLRYVPAREQTQPSPLEIKLNRVQRELRHWDRVALEVSHHAANEAHGWIVRPDGSIGRSVQHQEEPAACHQRSACTPRRVRPRARRRGAGRPRAQATRSSARSGDGPSDDDGESPPPPELKHGLVSPNLLRVLRRAER